MQERETKMNENRKVAILGLGSIGLRHAKNAMALGWPVIGYDRSLERCALLEDAGGKTVKSVDELWQQGWAGVIATPSGMHLDDLRQGVSAGVHLLVEKPISHTVDGVERILNEAKDKGIVVAVAFNLRFRPVVSAAREFLMSGKLGKFLWSRFICSSYLPDWRPSQDYRLGYANDPNSGGVIFDAIHELDLAQFLLGPAEVLTATCQQSHVLNLNSEDVADIVLEHESGERSSIHLDYITRPRRRGFDVCGVNGLLSVDLVERNICFWNQENEVAFERSVPSDPNEEYLLEMEDFLDAAAQGGAPLCAAGDSLRVLEVACQARSVCGLPTL